MANIIYLTQNMNKKTWTALFFFLNLFSITAFSTELHISWKSPSWSHFQSCHLTVFYELLNLPYCWSWNLFVILTDHNKIPSPPCYHLFLTCHSIKTDLYLTNPLHPYINVQVLWAILYTFPLVLKRKICLTIKFRIIAFILMTRIFYSGVTLLGEIRCLSLLGSKGLCDKQMLDEMMLDDK